MSRITLLVTVMLVAGTAAQCDAQCRFRMRARCAYYAAPSCCPMPSDHTVCDPYGRYPQATTTRFGYRAPFSFGYGTQAAKTPTPAAPKPAQEVQPKASFDQGISTERTEKGPVAPADDPPPDTAPAQLMTIVETAQAAGVFTKLLAYAKKSHLLEDVSGGPFTILCRPMRHSRS